MKTHELIFIAGAPGTGKTTIAKLLQERLHSPRIELSWIRGCHLNKTWSNRSKKEGTMSFDNIIFILKNYLKNGYKQVIATDFEDFQVQRFPELFKNKKFVIFTLVTHDDKTLKKRVLTKTRDSGYRDFKKAIKWNRAVQKRQLLQNEHRIDTTDDSPQEITRKIIKCLH